MPAYITIRIQKDDRDIATSISVPVRVEWTYEEAKKNILDRVVSELNRYAIDEVLSHCRIDPDDGHLPTLGSLEGIWLKDGDQFE